MSGSTTTRDIGGKGAVFRPASVQPESLGVSRIMSHYPLSASRPMSDAAHLMVTDVSAACRR